MSERADSPSGPGFIDLHSHTDESDGTLTPAELVQLAKKVGLDALAITDHDTFEGYEKAAGHAREIGLDLVRGIELNSRFYLKPHQVPKHVHLLAYFPWGEPSAEFHAWLNETREIRRSRNYKLTEELQKRGVEITLREVEARGRTLTGRPHFARVLVDKGYARDSDDAFRRYLGEEAPSYVERESKTTEEAIGIVRRAGGFPTVAHPIRIGLEHATERQAFALFKRAGLLGLEVYHSEHSAELQTYYRRLAEDLALLPTGGSDFHGDAKPDVQLGTGRGNVRVPRAFLEAMRSFDGRG